MGWAAALGGVAGASGGGEGGLLGNLFGYDISKSGNSTTNATQTTLSADEIQQLTSLIATLQGNSAQYSRTNAIADAQGFADQAIKDMTEKGLPAIATQQKSAGAYDSTSATQLSNDLQARTAAAISANTSNVVTQYANAYAQNQAQIAALYQILKGASTTQTSTTKTNEDQNNNGGAWGQATRSVTHGLGQVGNVIDNIGNGIAGLFGW